MTYEAVIADRNYSYYPIDYTVADGTARNKGQLLALTSSRTAATPSNNTSYKCGIAAREKVASDGRPNLAVYTEGRFFIYVSGAVVAGQQLCFASDIATYPNHLQVCNSGAITASGGQVFAIAETTQAGGVLGAVLCRLV